LANRELAAAGPASYQEKSRDIRARDEQQAARRGEQDLYATALLRRETVKDRSRFRLSIL
jgi:hypothetical protein